MKRAAGSGLALLIIAALMLSFAPCPAEEQNDRQGWTVMVYMVGSDLESMGELGSRNIDIMLSSLNEDTTLLIMMGGTQYWHRHRTGTQSALYEAKDGALTLLENVDTPMSDPGTLALLLAAGFRQSEGQHTALIFWDHGFGPVEGFGDDELCREDRRLTLDEIAAGLGYACPRKLDVIAFDACSMAGCETAYVLAPYAEYLLASQETVPDGGFDYTFLRTLSGAEDGCAFGEQAISCYTAYYRDLYERYPNHRRPYTLSLTRLSGMEALSQSLDAMLGDLGECIDRGELVEISHVRSERWGLSRSTTGEEYDFIDLRELAESCMVFSPAAGDVLDALDDCVASHDGSEAHANGLSLCFPYYANREQLSRWQTSLNLLHLPNGWHAFMTGYPGAVAAMGTIRRELNVERDGNRFTVRLLPEEERIFDRLKYFVYRALPEGGLCLVYGGNDYTLEGNVASVQYFGQCLMLTNGEEECVLPALLNQRDETHACYLADALAVTLNADSFETHSLPIKMRIEYSDEAGYELLSGFEVSDELVSGRRDIKPDEIFELMVVSYCFPVPSPEELPVPFYRLPDRLLPENTSLYVGGLQGEGANRDEARSLTISSGTLPESGETYYIQLVMVDVFNHETASPILELQ